MATKMIYEDNDNNELSIEFTEKSKKISVNYLNKKHTYNYDFPKKYKLRYVANFVMKQLSIDFVKLIGIESK